MKYLSIFLFVAFLQACSLRVSRVEPSQLPGTWIVLQAGEVAKPRREFRIKINAAEPTNTYRVTLGECTPDFIFFQIFGEDIRPVSVHELENGKYMMAICTGQLREHWQIAKTTASLFSNQDKLYKRGSKVYLRSLEGEELEIQRVQIYRMQLTAKPLRA